MAEIIKFERKKKFIDDPSLHPDDVLKLYEGTFSDIILIGWTKEDTLGWASSGEVTRETALYLIEHYKRILLSDD